MATLALTAALTFTPIAPAVMGERWIPAEYVDAIRKEAAYRNPSGSDVATPPPVETPLVELVAAYFPPEEVPRALRVIRCESLGDPNARNRNSGASGLFQHMPRYWAERSSAAGWPGADIFNPRANVAVAAWLWGQTGDWRHWVCRP